MLPINEKRITLDNVAEFAGLTGKHRRDAVRNWARHGKSGIRLEIEGSRRTARTTIEAFARFQAAVAVAEFGPPPKPAPAPMDFSNASPAIRDIMGLDPKPRGRRRAM